MQTMNQGVVRRGITSVLALSAAVAIGWSLRGVSDSAAQPSAVRKAPPTIDNATIAERVVGTSARVQAGEIVRISGNPKDIALLEALAVAVVKRGAHPILTTGTDSLAKAVNQARPEQYDAKVATAELALAKIIDVAILLPESTDPTVFNTVAPKRRQAWAKSFQAVTGTLRSRKVRLVDLDNGLYPSSFRAQQLNTSIGDLTEIFNAGIGADYSTIETRAADLIKAFGKGGELRITHTNGTDLKLKVKGKFGSSDGVISAADEKAGGGQLIAYLPAGEVYFVPVAGSAEGKLVDDRTELDGKKLEGLTVELKGGKITSITAKTGWDAVKEFWDGGGTGKLELSAVDLGINPAVANGTNPESWIAAGAITIVTGNNEWAGGKNKEPVGAFFQLQGATVTLNGQPLIDAGKLK